MSEFDPGRVLIRVASIDGESKVLESAMIEFLRIVHATESELHVSAPDPAFGWNFFLISVDRSMLARLAQLPQGGILKVKGDSLEQKFVNWLNGKAKSVGIGERLHFTLLSDLKSSRYGFF
ncbi:MAG: hypothetical protein MN733_38515 [Nitrososphaera sp.]|nr:hypothetical protein [Nitrososphaera sp.]